MTPRQFEATNRPLWDELEQALAALESEARSRLRSGAVRQAPEPVPAARLARLYRAGCEHLALARERAYPLHVVTRLEQLTSRAHQHIYRRNDLGLAALRDLLLYGIPDAFRALGGHLLAALLVTVIPMVAMGLATWRDPHFLLSLVSANEMRVFDQMFGPAAQDHLGRTAGDDWHMFGYYVMHNVGLAFQCFGCGLALGIGSLFMLAFNGLLAGAVAGFLVSRGDGERFFSFVVTHSAFELTAIVLAGAAGLKLGRALLAPGRATRAEALRAAAVATAPVMTGVFVLLVIAAAFEAFWSSAGWIAPGVKYAVGGACWSLVIAYLSLQGRRDAVSRISAAKDPQ